VLCSVSHKQLSLMPNFIVYNMPKRLASTDASVPESPQSDSSLDSFGKRPMTGVLSDYGDSQSRDPRNENGSDILTMYVAIF
jgi:hypothetical protein